MDPVDVLDDIDETEDTLPLLLEIVGETYGEYLVDVRLRSAWSLKAGLDRDLVGDEAGKLRVSDLGEEGDEREEVASDDFAGSMPKVAMSSTKEGSVVI